MAKPTYHIERKTEAGWLPFPLTNMQALPYCKGYMDAVESSYTSPPMRLIRTVGDKKYVIRETQGHSGVSLNATNVELAG